MQKIKEIAEKIQKAGGRLYLVGGALRDEMLLRPKHDSDYCVVGISLEKFQELFPEAILQGKAFPVFILEGEEFALARKETKTGRGHKDFKVCAKKEVTIEQDLARRDATINSIAKDVLTGELVDPFGGKEDLEKGILRATTKHFAEDPLRVYRMARLAAQLDFTVEEKTLKMMHSLKEELTSLSKERVFTEFRKALHSQSPSVFFEVLRKAEVLEVHFLEIFNLIGAEQPEKYHPEGDGYNHTMLVLDKVTKETKDIAEERREEICFAALVHDLGKGVTPKEEYPHHYGHEKTGIALVSNLGNRIGVPNRWIKCGKTAVREHMLAGRWEQMKSNTKVSFLERVSKSILGLDGLEIIARCDQESSKGGEFIAFSQMGKECLRQITGKQIQEKYGISEGIRLKEKLHEERVLWMKARGKLWNDSF